MNLQKLFEMQRQLDEHIEKEHPRQDGEDRLAKKILALQVELGELCNCWRGFKFWSKDQKPRTVLTEIPSYAGIPFFADAKTRNPLLEEFADCLHFLLSIGLELNFTDIDVWKVKEATTTNQFIECFGTIYNMHFQKRVTGEVPIEMYEHLFACFIGLGEMLGFTWEQIGEAYMRKNRENHQRQESGY